MDPNWVTIQAITPGQNRHAVMAELRRERNARGDTTPYRHAPGCIQALKPRKEARTWPSQDAADTPTLTGPPPSQR